MKNLWNSIWNGIGIAVVGGLASTLVIRCLMFDIRVIAKELNRGMDKIEKQDDKKKRR